MLQFTFQSQKIPRITNGCSSPFSLSHYYKSPFTTEILYAILFSCKGNMINTDAFPGLTSSLLIFMTIDISGLSSYTVFCVGMCHVKPSFQFIHVL